jgi:hypothetical protein
VTVADFRRRVDTPIAVAALTLLAYLPFLTIRLIRSEWDVSRFVCAGENYCDPTATPPGLFVASNSDGYDGQFFYRLALDPFTPRRTDFGIRLDKPAYRQARIVYPLLAWIASAGNAEWTPFALLFLNVLCLGAIGWLGGGFAKTLGRHAAWGLLISLYPGFLLTLSRDTGEIMSSAALLAAMVALQRQRLVACSVALCAAALTRETTLGLAAAVAIVALGKHLFRGNSSAPRAHQSLAGGVWAMAPVALYVLWQLGLSRIWGHLPLHEADGNLGRPFDGLSLFLQRAFIPFRGDARLMAAQIGLLGLIGGLALAGLRDARFAPAIRLAWCFYAALLVSLSSMVWSEDWAYLRAASEFYLISAAIVIAAPTAARAAACGLAAAVFAWTAQVHRDG